MAGRRPKIQLSRLKRQGGLSLIELMIAMALGLILTLGVVEIFLGSNKTYRLTDSIAKLQENLRFSLSTFSYDGRMAGHAGCMVGQPTNHVDTSSSSALDLIYNNSAIVGWGYSGTGLGDAYTVTDFTPGNSGWSNGTSDAVPSALSGEVIPGTDILVLNTSDITNVEISGNASGSALNTVGKTDIKKGTIISVIAGDCSGGDLFQNTSEATDSSVTRDGGGSPGNTSSEDLGIYDSDASVYTFRSTAYYIGAGTDGEPSLFRERLDAGDTGSGAVELLSGVENMQVLYGVANGADKQASQYVPSSDVSDWNQVVSFRVALLMRSADMRIDTDEAQVSNLVGVKVTSPKDRRARLVGTTTVGIRNRLE